MGIKSMKFMENEAYEERLRIIIIEKFVTEPSKVLAFFLELVS